MVTHIIMSQSFLYLILIIRKGISFFSECIACFLWVCIQWMRSYHKHLSILSYIVAITAAAFVFAISISSSYELNNELVVLISCAGSVGKDINGRCRETPSGKCTQRP